MTVSNLAVLTALAGVVFGYLSIEYLGSPYKRARLRRSINCLMGNHAPGRVEDVVGGRRLQRCDYCDKVVREYQVTKNQLNKESIRRTL
jgi:hypothetical protein